MLERRIFCRQMIELRAQCLSHDELFRILKTHLEERDVPDLGAESCERRDLVS